ncbi:cobalamin biosynthesis protein [Thermoleophilum album]|uniref:CobD/CbiB family cobalamin biosynthesis protein n=1 Tax=Thermoleophilum album TaxID=29539 RepID=UPI00237D013B|nr:CobD/CbiB family cobalamin biosynthesis protein [Thermoleophilum album]WDT93140.1 cobalamin biosynthesis protein [Thermoleophilum album]
MRVGVQRAAWRRARAAVAVRLAQLAVGVALDQLLADPSRGHPVAGFGRLASTVERRWWSPSRRRGAVATALLVAGAGGAAAAIGATGRSALWRIASGGAIVWTCLGSRSLLREAEAIERALAAGDLASARARLPALCGRDPHELDTTGIARAVIESLAENANDAALSTAVWTLLAGPPGAAVHRAANTLDGMWGHRNRRYERFGWAAARLDDFLGFAGARVGVLLVAVQARRFGSAPAAVLRGVRRDARRHPSPNAGPLKAAFAAALGVRLGGPVSYFGARTPRPWIGDGRDPTVGDLARARSLAARLCYGWTPVARRS